jgi:drug/metabolite transporter (DMT)-like permease
MSSKLSCEIVNFVLVMLKNPLKRFANPLPFVVSGHDRNIPADQSCVMSTAANSIHSTDHTISRSRGILLVAGSAIVWSFGGAIARFLTVADSWTVVFWRSIFAVLFLLVFMLLRDGPRGTVALFKGMGLAGLGVALCFAVASTSFVVALAYTTVANILLMQAGVPLIAALLTWTLFREKISGATWAAIAAVIAGVAIMVSESFTGKVSPIGDGLALLISVMFAIATVITRRHAEVRMTPAVCLGITVAACASGLLASHYAVSAVDLGWLIAFGAVNLGLGLAMFTTGARLIPAALAALVGTLEPVLGPIWVWLVHNEIPSGRTLIGGAVVFAALVIHLIIDWQRQSRAQSP